MKALSKAAAATAVLAAALMSTAAFAGNKPSDTGGASASSPGQKMQDAGGPVDGQKGASTLSPGHQTQDSNTAGIPPGKLASPGASGFAPGTPQPKKN